jgi:hypothetical protein
MAFGGFVSRLSNCHDRNRFASTPAFYAQKAVIITASGHSAREKSL